MFIFLHRAVNSGNIEFALHRSTVLKQAGAVYDLDSKDNSREKLDISSVEPEYARLTLHNPEPRFREHRRYQILIMRHQFFLAAD